MKKIDPIVNSGADGSFNSSQFKGLYRAIVENNKDPKKLGRVQIRVPKMSGSAVPTEQLPWAFPCFSSAGAGYGSFIVPEVGEVVFVAFEAEDRSKPVYLGSTYGTGPQKSKTFGTDDNQFQSTPGELETPSMAQKDKPDIKILYKTHKGAIIYMTDESGEEELYIQDKDEQFIRFKDKKIEVLGKDEINIKCGQVEIDIKKEDEFTMTTNGTTIKIKGGSVEIEADDSTIKTKLMTVETDLVEMSAKTLVLDSELVTMSAPLMNINSAALVVTGNMAVAGSFIASV